MNFNNKLYRNFTLDYWSRGGQKEGKGEVNSLYSFILFNLKELTQLVDLMVGRGEVKVFEFLYDNKLKY